MDARGWQIFFSKGQRADVLGYAGPLTSAIMWVSMSVFSTIGYLLLCNKHPPNSVMESIFTNHHYLDRSLLNNNDLSSFCNSQVPCQVDRFFSPISGSRREGCRWSTAVSWWLGTDLQDGWQLGVNWLRTSWTWAERASWEVKELQRATIGRGPDSGMKECQHFSPSLRNPTFTHRLVCARGFSELSGKRKRVATPLGSFRPHSPMSRASPPTKGWRSIQSTPKLLGIIFILGRTRKLDPTAVLAKALL